MTLAPEKFRYWTVLAKPTGRHWLCKCICGVKRRVDRYTLLAGQSTNCGCMKAKETGLRFRKHGLSETAEFHAWYDVKTRCTKPESAAFQYYGGRGIKMCDRWLYGEGDMTGAECFVKDMGKRPKGKFSLERINTDGHYEPDNCSWLPMSLQARNRRVCKRHLYKDQLLTLADIRDQYGVTLGRLQTRLKLGWSIEDAIERPTYYHPPRRASAAPAVRAST